MLNFDKYEKLDREKTEALLDGCTDRDGFIRIGCDYLHTLYTGLASPLTRIQEFLDYDFGKIEEKFDYRNGYSFIDLVEEMITQLDTIYFRPSEAFQCLSEYFDLLMEYSGYSEEETKNLFMNCVKHDLIHN